MNTRCNTRKAAIAVVLAGGALIQTADAAIQVELDGQPLNTSVAPVKIRNRTVVPMRDIFEALGATVMWNPATQGITAQRDNNTVELAINNRRAAINGRTVLLDQPATLLRGRTMVPLRFVSEAMGADVKWNDAMQLVSITTNGGMPVAGLPGNNYPNNPNNNLPIPGSQTAGVRYISVPTGAVVPVSLDQSLSSATTRVGQGFTATVISQRLGDSEFPAGTKIEGRIVEARPRQGDNPGVLDLEFRSALFPDGTRIPLRGELISLDQDSVVSTDGRITAKTSSGQSSGDRLKIVGIGAGLGFVLGKVLDTNSTISTVLGAAGGYLYSRTRDRNKAADAMLAQNTKLGVRLTDNVTYADTHGYATERENFLRTSFSSSVLGVPTARDAVATTYQTPANQPTYTQPGYQQPAYQQPGYVPPATQPNYVPPVNQPNYPAYAGTQPNYVPPVSDPNYPPYTGTVPPATSVNNQATYPATTYPNYPTGNVDLGQQPAYPATTYPQPGYPQPAYPQAGYPQPGYPQAGANVGAYRTIRIPANVVVPVTMDTEISSATARVGQTFTASVVSERIGDSEFPAGTKIEGVVLEARPRQGDQPGVLDLDFRNAILPDGTVVPVNGRLMSLDDKDLTQSSGRIVAKAGSGQSTGDRLKIVGIGAGLGFVLGKVLDKNSTLTAILGAAGGYLYSRTRDNSASEAVVTRGTKLGVRLNNAVAYNDRGGYYDYRTQYLRS